MSRVMLAVFVVAFVQSGDKVEFRYKFEKGQKFELKLKQNMSMKLDEVPEAFKGLLGDDPVDVKFEGLLETEVVEMAEDGKATLEGKWRTLKVKGKMMQDEIDFDHDAAKPAPKKEGNEPAAPGFGAIEDGLRTMASQTIKLKLDSRGRLETPPVGKRGGGGGLLEASQILSINGLMGPFPKEKMGRGDAWKGEETLGMPGLAGAVSFKVASENSYDSDEKIGDRDCALIKSKFAVSSDDKKDEAQVIPIKMKSSGTGEGKTWFARDGLPARSSNDLKVKVTATVTNPGDGSEMEIKASLRIEQGYEVKK